MKKNIYLFPLTVLLLSLQMHVHGQTFLNGSFESTTGGCSYNITNASFDAMMSNCHAFGSASQLDILDNTCGFGSAEDGTHFVGVAVDITNTQTDAFSMELSAPLIAGNSYTVSFYNRKDVGYNANLLEIGYSNDSLLFGYSIDTVALPTTSWGFVSFTFIPAINCSYITIQTIAGSYGWNFVDDFTISEATGINTVTSAVPVVQVYPNPTSGMISIGVETASGFVSATVRDVQGNILFVSQSAQFDLSAFSAGVYILEVLTSNGVSVRRIVRE